MPDYEPASGLVDPEPIHCLADDRPPDVVDPLSTCAPSRMRLIAAHANALDTSRELKPGLPLVGTGGQPIRDDIEFDYTLFPG